jgi:hypothetical protein
VAPGGGNELLQHGVREGGEGGGGGAARLSKRGRCGRAH